jgi:hypothetical protein
MDFKTQYPDFASVEEHIRRARAERSVAIAHAFINVWGAAERGLKRLARAATRNRRTVLHARPLSSS